MPNLSERENEKKENQRHPIAGRLERISQKKATLPVNAGKQIQESLTDGSTYPTAPKTSHLCLLLPETE